MRADSWDPIEPEDHENLCNSLGLKYSEYDDPDKLIKAMTEKAQGLKGLGADTLSEYERIAL